MDQDASSLQGPLLMGLGLKDIASTAVASQQS